VFWRFYGFCRWSPYSFRNRARWYELAAALLPYAGGRYWCVFCLSDLITLFLIGNDVNYFSTIVVCVAVTPGAPKLPELRLCHYFGTFWAVVILKSWHRKAWSLVPGSIPGFQPDASHWILPLWMILNCGILIFKNGLQPRLVIGLG